MHPAPELVTAMYNLLINHTDERDMGDHNKGEPQPRRTNETLIRNIHDNGRPDHLTEELIVKHLDGRTTLYTKPRRGTDRVWVQFDVDAHQGEPDADAVANYVEELWPGLTYREPSTNNRGIHVYVWVESPQDLRRFNENLVRYKRWLGHLLHDLGYKATVEFKHTFTLLNQNRTKVRHRGDMAKAPRFANGLCDLQRFESLEAIGLDQLGARIKAAHGGGARGGRAGHGCNTTHVNKDYPSTLLRFRSVEGKMPVSPPANPNVQSMTGTGFVNDFSGVFTDAQSGDAFVRMWDAFRALRRQIRGLPTVDELLLYYERNFNAGPEHRSRRERATAVVRYVEANLGSSSNGFWGYAGERERLLELCAPLADLYRNDPRIRYRYGITTEDLAIGLYTIERAAFNVDGPKDKRYSLASGSIGGMFDKLRTAGETKRGCRHGSKEAAIKQILIFAGLAIYLDKGYIRDYVGMKIGLGPKHPAHATFVRVLARYPVVTARQIQWRWEMEAQQRTMQRRANAAAPSPAHMPVECPPPASPFPRINGGKPRGRSVEQMMTKKEREQYAVLQTKLASEPGLNFVAVERALVAFRTPIRQREDAKRQRRQARDQCIRAITKQVLSEYGWHASVARDAAFANVRKLATQEARQRLRAEMVKGGTPASIMNDLAQQWQEEYDDLTCHFHRGDKTHGTSYASPPAHERGDAPGRFADRLEDTAFAPHDQMSGVAGMMLPPP